MKKIAITAILAVLAGAAAAAAQGPPPPTQEHQWLHQLAGQWEADLEVWSTPGQPPLKLKSTENARRLGGYWIVSEAEVAAPGPPYARAATLGYDPQKKKYVATAVDSNSMQIGRYEGTVDAAGKTLTLEGETPSPFDPTQSVRVREVIEVKGPDQKVSTTSLDTGGGNWVTLVRIDSRRKK